MASAILRVALANKGRAALSLLGKTYSYGNLLASAQRQAQRIGARERGKDACVVVLAESGPEYLIATWATWLSGMVAVPLSPSHPSKELEYFVKDCGAKAILHCPSLEEKARGLSSATGVGTDLVECADVGDVEVAAEALDLPGEEDGALLVYTSGTTGKPKGALHTHGSLEYQMRSMSEAWEWQRSDKILHCLPLHHIHGMVNALHCAHFNAAHVEFLGSSFSPRRVWDALAEDESISVFMGVPTMYAYLLSHLDRLKGSEGGGGASDLLYLKYVEAAKRLRLAVSGSSACPVPVMQKWAGISGEVLLERYGMSETGMILSNPLESGRRIVGTVGRPLPYVDVEVTEEGELLVRSKCMMKGYYNKPKETEAAFVQVGGEDYFKTGDSVAFDEASGVYTIKGRISADIIKHKGYKVSALDIENVLLSHSCVKECAVVGVGHELFGEAIVAVVVKNEEVGGLESLGDLQALCKDHLADYQTPQRVEFRDEIPRNAMGKVNKRELAKSISS